MFSKLPIIELKANNGFDKLLAFLGRKLKKGDISDSWDKFNNFDKHSKESSQSISDFSIWSEIW